MALDAIKNLSMIASVASSNVSRHYFVVSASVFGIYISLLFFDHWIYGYVPLFLVITYSLYNFLKGVSEEIVEVSNDAFDKGRGEYMRGVAIALGVVALTVTISKIETYCVGGSDNCSTVDKIDYWYFYLSYAIALTHIAFFMWSAQISLSKASRTRRYLVGNM